MYQKYIKRLLDIILSLIGLILLSPILLIVSILVRIKLGKPIIFKQKRPGLNEKIFTLYKFRTMTDAKDKNGKLLSDEERLTKFGKLLRSTSLDELPELFNILKGDMSFVGPRPQLVRDMVFMSKNQRKRHTVRPGLTGLAQVSGRNAIKWEDKLSTDLVYIKKISFINDIKICIKTFLVVFKREGITEDGMATALDYGDYLLKINKVTKKDYDKKQEEAIKLLGNYSLKEYGWKYYNHGIIPICPPHECPNLELINNNMIFKCKESNKAVLARWISNFDCKEKTDFWYIIKDDSFDINKLKSNYRYKINKGCKNFDVEIINPKKLTKEMFTVFKKANLSYSKQTKSNTNYLDFCDWINSFEDNIETYGAFCKQTGELCGFTILTKTNNNFIDLTVQKANPSFEKFQVNAALIYKVLQTYSEKMDNKLYISDGSRNVLHETKFQDYLEKYFLFRKAYCHLNIIYNPSVKKIIPLLYKMRKIFSFIDFIPLIHSLNGVLKMEEIVRNEKIEYEK